MIGKSGSGSFVVAIALNDHKVMIMDNRPFLVILVSITIMPLFILIGICSAVIIYRKDFLMALWLWFRLKRDHTVVSSDRWWETSDNEAIVLTRRRGAT